jgi:hypothetical protein
MSLNPYQSPEFSGQERTVITSSPMKGILYGFLFSFLGSILFWAVFDFLFIVYEIAVNKAGEEAFDSLDSLPFYSVQNIIGTGISCLFDVYGGFISAKYWLGRKYLSGVLVCALILVVYNDFFVGFIPSFEILIANSLIIISVFWGIYLCGRNYS